MCKTKRTKKKTPKRHRSETKYTVQFTDTDSVQQMEVKRRDKNNPCTILKGFQTLEKKKKKDVNEGTIGTHFKCKRNSESKQRVV